MDRKKRIEERNYHYGEELRTIRHPFPPFYQEDSVILILGSFPSVKSREEKFFYAHPQNRFWKMLAIIFEEETPKTKKEKIMILKKYKIALWDVIQSCNIKASSDSSIQNVVPNDLEEIIRNSNITKILCNGSISYKYYTKYQEKLLSRNAISMPSTSPANAATSLGRLVEIWRKEIIKI